MLKQAFLAGFSALCLTANAQAATPPYHVNDGYYGSVTIKASGSCGFKPVTYKKAWFGEVFDSTDTSQGAGIITASGELLVLEEDYAPIRYSNNSATGLGKDISYTNMVGAELVAFVQDFSGCNIWSIVPNANSRATIKWDMFANKDRLNLRANFKGFESEVCSGPPSNQQCRADSFSGSIVFQGDRASQG